MFTSKMEFETQLKIKERISINNMDFQQRAVAVKKLWLIVSLVAISVWINQEVESTCNKSTEGFVCSASFGDRPSHHKITVSNDDSRNDVKFEVVKSMDKCATYNPLSPSLDSSTRGSSGGMQTQNQKSGRSPDKRELVVPKKGKLEITIDKASTLGQCSRAVIRNCRSPPTTKVDCAKFITVK